MPNSRSPLRWLLVTVSVGCVIAGLATAANIAWFMHRSAARGGALVARERHAIEAAGRAVHACQRPADTEADTEAGAGVGAKADGEGNGTPHGLLEIPALGMTAPVLQGTGEDVLDDAVGHVPASVWPGHAGTSVLAAHDVTWFSRIDALSAGAQVRYVTPCRTYLYRVTGHQVVRSGYPLYTTSAGRLVLDTCYPLNALYITSYRYLVYADLIAAAPTPAAPVTPAQTATAPTATPPTATAQTPTAQTATAPFSVNVPPALAAEGLTLAQNPTPLGTLSLAGSPLPGWRQTNAPLRAEAVALTGYFGIIRTAEQGERSWWRALAPSVPMSAAAALRNGQVSYLSQLEITLRVDGSQVLGAELRATIAVAGSTHHLTVTEAVTGQHRLVVTAFTL